MNKKLKRLFLIYLRKNRTKDLKPGPESIFIANLIASNKSILLKKQFDCPEHLITDSNGKTIRQAFKAISLIQSKKINIYEK